MDNFPGPEEERCGPGDRDSLLLGLRQQPENPLDRHPVARAERGNEPVRHGVAPE